MIKTFKLGEDKKINDFLETVFVEQGGVQIIDQTVVVTYQEKEEYKKGFVDNMIDQLTKKIAEEEVLLDSRKIDLAFAQEKEDKKVIEEKEKSVQTCEEGIEVLKRKLAHYEQLKGNN